MDDLTSYAQDIFWIGVDEMASKITLTLAFCDVRRLSPFDVNVLIFLHVAKPLSASFLGVSVSDSPSP